MKQKAENPEYRKKINYQSFKKRKVKLRTHEPNKEKLC